MPHQSKFSLGEVRFVVKNDSIILLDGDPILAIQKRGATTPVELTVLTGIIVKLLNEHYGPR